MESIWNALGPVLAPQGVMKPALFRAWMTQACSSIKHMSDAVGEVLMHTPVELGQQAFDALVNHRLRHGSIGAQKITFSTDAGYLGRDLQQIATHNPSAFHTWFSANMASSYEPLMVLVEMGRYAPAIALDAFNVPTPWPNREYRFAPWVLLEVGAHILNTCHEHAWRAYGEQLCLAGVRKMSMNDAENFSLVERFLEHVDVEEIVRLIEAGSDSEFRHFRWAAEILQSDKPQALKDAVDNLCHRLLANHPDWDFSESNGEIVGLIELAHYTRNLGTRALVLNLLSRNADYGEPEFDEALNALWGEQPELGREFLSYYDMEENVTALTTGILPARHFWGKPSTQMSRTLFTELPPKKAVEVLWDALSTASESSSSLEKLFKRLDPDTWTEAQRAAICSSGWPMHASLLFADFGARQDEWNEAGVQAWWSSMPEPLALLSKLHPEHQDVWRASWENLFMEIPNTDGALRYYMASVFDTIAATYCPQKSFTHAGMRAIVDSLGCSPLVFLKGLSTQPTAEIFVPLLIDEKSLDASYR